MNAISGGSWAVESFEPINEAALAIGGITRAYPLDPDAEVDSVLLDGRKQITQQPLPECVDVADNGNMGRASPVHHRLSLWRRLAELLSRQKRMVEPNPAVRDGLGRRIRLTGLLRKKPW